MMQIDVDEALGGFDEGFEDAEALEDFFKTVCDKALHNEESVESLDFRRTTGGDWRKNLRGFKNRWSELSRDKQRYLIAQAYLLERAVRIPDPYYD